MSQCHLLNQWANAPQQADPLQLSPTRAELSFQGRSAAPAHLSAAQAPALGQAEGLMCCGYSASGACPAWSTGTRGAEIPAAALPTQDKADGGPCCHTVPQQVSHDLSFTSHPGSAALARHLVLLCFLSPRSRRCCMHWQFYLLPCPSVTSPGKLQRRRK